MDKGSDVERMAEDDPLAHSETLALAPDGIGATELDVDYDSLQVSGVRSVPHPGAAIRQYEIIRELGHGGMGTVFLARDTRLGRRVAIKFLTRYNRQLAEMFINEARTTAQCRHENIVVIHDVDEFDGMPYMVLEYIEGPTLRVWLQRRQRQQVGRAGTAGLAPGDQRAATSAAVSPALAAEIMVPVLRALACAHERGIVHRDLKPENVILSNAGPIKVLDFGIAKLFSPAGSAADLEDRKRTDTVREDTIEDTVSGTLPYMSPEQRRASDIDHRSDVWAAGIMLYELVTGRHPLAPLSLETLSQVPDNDVPMPRLSDMHPDLGPIGPIIDRCLLKARDRRTADAATLLAELEPLTGGASADAGAGDHSPFAGLSAFQEDDARRFFGRDPDIAAMTARLRQQRFVALTGPSGAGKSSFVRAGVIPALKRSGDGWHAYIIRPGRHPLGSLASILMQLPEYEGQGRTGEVGELVETLGTQPGLLGARLRAHCRNRLLRGLVFVDQFEELYTLCDTPSERAAFIACLEGVADDEASPLRVIVALRSDFLDRVADERATMEPITRGLVFLPSMDEAGLREALSRPVEQVGHRFENPEMIASMLRSLADTRSPLPLLQFAATQLWHRRDRERRLLTQASYDQLGGVAGALAAHADAVVSGLAARDLQLVRAVLLRLVTGERTRAIVSLSELAELADAGEGETVERIVRDLAEARLVLIEAGSVDLESDDGATGLTAELVHESLIESWPRLRDWLDEDKEEAHFLARVRSAARQWQVAGRGDDVLWRGQAAREAEHWHAHWQARSWSRLSERDRRYLSAVVALSQRSRRRRRNLAVSAFAALTAIALVIAYLAVRADRAAQRADQEAARVREQALVLQREAARTQEEATRARNVSRMATARELTADPTTVLSLLREVEPGELPRGWSALARWALDEGVARAVLPHAGRVRGVSFSPDGTRLATAGYDHKVRIWSVAAAGQPLVLDGHRNKVYTVQFSPDGKRVLSASRDRTARIFDVDDPATPVVLVGHEHTVVSASFSPSGRYVVTASSDQTARVWASDGQGQPTVLRGHTDVLTTASFSPDGTQVVTGSRDDSVRLWHLASGETTELRGHEDDILAASFSPDGAWLVSGSEDHTARLWPVDGSAGAAELRGHGERVVAARFLPGGDRVITASGDSTARIWSRDGRELVVLDGHLATIVDLAVSADGRHALTLSGDWKAALWDLEKGVLQQVLHGHQGEVVAGAFSPDGTWVATASFDRNSRLWRVDDAQPTRRLRGHSNAVAAVTYSADGARLASAGYDSTLRVWNADGSGRPLVLRGHEEAVMDVAFSPDGTRIASVSMDRTLRVWSADDSEGALALRGHEHQINSVAFSSDGERIATASHDGTIRIWNADGSGEPLILRGDTIFYWASFSPDGRRVVSASFDRTARVWNAEIGGQFFVLHGHDDLIYSVEFSPDGSLIGTGSFDKTARIWSAEKSASARAVFEHDDAVSKIAFSPDGERLATTSNDNTVRVWDIASGQAPLVLIGEHHFNSVEFSPDGSKLVAGSVDHTIWLWGHLRPLRPEATRLWTATDYCLPADRRQRLLGVSQEMARRNLESCERRIQR